MNYILSDQFTWWGFLLNAAILLLLYFLLRFVLRTLAVAVNKNEWVVWMEKLLHDLLTMYEPLAIILLGSIFVFINPPFHGLLAGLLVFAGFSHVRNYMSGRFVHLDRKVVKGKHIKTRETEGVITRLGNLGLQIQTAGGPHRINYSTLLDHGYTLISGDENGGFCHLRVFVAKGEEKQLDAQHLADLLMMTPFLDWNFKPEFEPAQEGASFIEAKFLLKDEQYLYDLKRLMKEWGFSCEIAVMNQPALNLNLQ